MNKQALIDRVQKIAKEKNISFKAHLLIQTIPMTMFTPNYINFNTLVVTMFGLGEK